MTTLTQRNDLEPTLPVELDPPTGSRPALAIARDEHTGAVDPDGVPKPVLERKPWMPPDFTGKTLGGRYEIERMLGFGGMATVYQATHIQIHKPVAVKVLNPEYADDPEIAGRFLQEARTASRLRHEHIIDITDFGHTDDGTVFFVMELLEGEDLSATVMEDGPLAPMRVIAIAEQICDALACAHQNGIIHRDIKPANCFRISRGNNPDFIKVLDFGIAKVATVDREVQRTTGTPLGTPGYMALELLKGEAYDHRVDIYAVGVLMYKLLTNKMPFPAANTYGAVVRQIDGDPIPPRQAAPEREIPEALEALILRAIARTPTERHQSASELREALEAVARDLGRGEGRLGRDPLAWENHPQPATGEVQLAPAPIDAPALAPRWRRAVLPLLIGAAGVTAGTWFSKSTAPPAPIAGAISGDAAPANPSSEVSGPHAIAPPSVAADLPNTTRDHHPTAAAGTTAADPTPAGTTSADPTSADPTPADPTPADPTPADPTPAAASTSAGETSRPLPREVSKSVVHRRLDAMPALERCKAQHLSGFGSEPALTIEITIDGPTGKIKATHALSGGDLAPIGACVLGKLDELRFPAAQRDTTLTHTFEF